MVPKANMHLDLLISIVVGFLGWAVRFEIESWQKRKDREEDMKIKREIRDSINTMRDELTAKG